MSAVTKTIVKEEKLDVSSLVSEFVESESERKAASVHVVNDSELTVGSYYEVKCKLPYLFKSAFYRYLINWQRLTGMKKKFSFEIEDTKEKEVFIAKITLKEKCTG